MNTEVGTSSNNVSQKRAYTRCICKNPSRHIPDCLCKKSSRSMSQSQPSRAPKPTKRSEKPTVAYLQNLGIKVKDYAFEKTNLPPVRAYRVQPTQIQPGIPRQLQRQSTEPDDGSQPLSQGTQHLERRITEPAVSPPPPARMPAYEHLNIQATVYAGGYYIASVAPTEDETNLNISANQSVYLSASQQSGTAAAAIFSSSPLTPLSSSPFLSTLQANSSRPNTAYDLRSPTTIPRVLQPRYSLRKRPASTNVATSKPSKRAKMSASSESNLNSRTQGRSPNIKKKPRNDAGPCTRTPSKRASDDSGKDKRKRA